jgi:hypothetical protein
VIDAASSGCCGIWGCGGGWKSVAEAGQAALAAAQAGRDSVTPLRSKIGRASLGGGTHRRQGRPWL